MTLETFAATWISPIRNATVDMLSAFFDTIVGSGPAKGTKHEGLDIVVPVGTPVYAPRDGTVKNIEFQPGSGGNVLTLEHGDGYETVYAHLDSIAVKIGDRVTQGVEVAKSGDTGFVTGPHLHWVVKRNGNEIDPLDLFDPFRDVPDSIYRGATDALVAWMERILEDDIAEGKTWGEWLGGTALFNSDFVGAPVGGFGTKLAQALDKLEWRDRVISPSDFEELASEILEAEGPTDPIAALGDAVGTIGAVFAFLLDPVNWARILALIAGGAIAFVGFRTMWEATNT